MAYSEEAVQLVGRYDEGIQDDILRQLGILQAISLKIVLKDLSDVDRLDCNPQPPSTSLVRVTLIIFAPLEAHLLLFLDQSDSIIGQDAFVLPSLQSKICACTSQFFPFFPILLPSRH